MADVHQIIRILGYRGVTVALENGQLAASPRRRLDDELRRLIAHFKPALIAFLEHHPELPSYPDGENPETCALAERLARGWDLIDHEPDPARKDRLNDHWIGLLDTYVTSHRRKRDQEAA